MGPTFLVLFLSVGISASCDLSYDTKMIVDVVDYYLQPTSVLAKVCWNFPHKLSLTTQLRSKKATMIQFITDPEEINKFEAFTTLVIVDWTCPDSEKFLEQADRQDVFRKPYRFLIIANINEFIETAEQGHLKILVNSEVAIAEKSQNDTFHLKLVHRIDMTTKLITEEFGVWSASKGFVVSDAVTKTSKLMRRKDLNGKEVSASYVIVNNKTRTQLHLLDRDLKIDHVTKTTYNIIEPLYYFMNATKALVFTNIWGYAVNNTWNGMVGDIDSGRAEICGALSFISVSRIGILDYISQPVPILPKFLFRDPPLSFQNNLFILPFRGAVWSCIGGLVLFLVLVIYVNAKWEKTKDEEVVMNDATILKPDVSDVGMLVISAITQQGNTNFELKGSLGRLVTFIMFLIFLFLYTSYAANIVALLQSNSHQIRTLTDLLNSRLELGVENETYNRYYFPIATDPVRKAIYENKVLKTGYKPNFMSLEEGVKRIQNKDAPFAFHMNLGVGYKVVEEQFYEHEKCDLREISYYPNALPWTCARKASPFREIYKIGLNRIQEHGLNDRVYRIFYVRKPVCNMRGGNFASVNMVDFHPVLLWMLYGMSLSVCLLMVEILLHKWQVRSELRGKE